MELRKDISLDATYMNANNDLEWVESDQQHIQDTISATAGYWKESPLDGCDIDSYLNSSGQEQVLARSIFVQLQSDLYVVKNPTVYFDSSGQLVVTPNATIWQHLQQ